MITKGCSEIFASPNLKLFFELQLVLILGTVILRTVRLARVIHWAGRFAVNFTTTIMFWIISIGIIPYIVFGNNYLVFAKNIIKSL